MRTNKGALTPSKSKQGRGKWSGTPTYGGKLVIKLAAVSIQGFLYALRCVPGEHHHPFGGGRLRLRRWGWGQSRARGAGSGGKTAAEGAARLQWWRCCWPRRVAVAAGKAAAKAAPPFNDLRRPLPTRPSRIKSAPWLRKARREIRAGGGQRKKRGCQRGSAERFAVSRPFAGASCVRPGVRQCTRRCRRPLEHGAPSRGALGARA